MKVAVSFILLPYFRYLIFISYLLIFSNLELLSYHLTMAVSFIVLLICEDCLLEVSLLWEVNGEVFVDIADQSCWQTVLSKHAQ